MFRRPADFVIGKLDAPYLLRWWVIPRNRFFNIYLHQILRSDDDRALHDHPWWNISIILSGGYYEVLPDFQVGRYINRPASTQHRKWRGPGKIVLRRSTDSHRLELASDARYERRVPCWSLFITGPNVRTWGFWCPQGWRRWQDFVEPTAKGNVGLGCD